MDPTYFICTLGQAAALGNQQPHQNVNDFVDAQAATIPDRPAVGFPAPTSDDAKGAWDYKVYTFSEVRKGTLKVAQLLKSTNGDVVSTSSTIALLCPSTPEFLFGWLALMKLGYAVLLIAPQCQPAAIRSLCDQCEVDLLFYDEVYAEQAKKAAVCPSSRERTAQNLEVKPLPFEGPHDVLQLASKELRDASEIGIAVKAEDVAYLHHTSGTSSGIPKPIPQPHCAAVGVLPSFNSGKDNATFTTTPLYHGGIADLFRAWSSGALIWLFPGKGVPITATNIVKCLDIAASASKKDVSIPSVTYFSSVPYVLQMLEADTLGLRYLQAMSIVGVGGAALPVEIGDRLVGKNINLISRFGSAECGFLMSSHRDYTKDGEWQYLRQPQDSAYIRFEPREGDLGELIVLDGWPHMAKRNREDGSYATADLFEPHPSIEGAWKYHSRADSQLTLVTGKKFDPAPMESAIATSELVEDALIFGNGQPYPGVLLFRSQKAVKMRDVDFAQQIWPALDRMNNESQGHARISKNMVVPMPVLNPPLEKSSKGTIIRGAAEKRFAKDIDSAYAQIEGGDQTSVKDEDVVGAVRSIVTSAALRKAPLKDDTDLFSYGIDSVAGMQIRGRLRQLLPADRRDLPITIVEDYGNISGIADYVLKRRHGQTVPSSGEDTDEHAYMRQLVEQYSKFQASIGDSSSVTSKQDASESHNGDVVVLTGATGALGAHILDQYRSSTSVSKVYCLVRGADTYAARERVAKALEQRKLRSLDDDPNGKVVILPAHLADSRLGLDEKTYSMLAREATVIMHVAWSVNFRLKLHSFAKDSIGGLSHLISLALAAPESRQVPKVAFCSSVASVMAYPTSPIPEQLIDDPAAATELGYSRSKWVAEHICAQANENDRLRDRVSVYRVGQLAGDTKTGVWNAKEAWPLMLGSVKETGALPDLQSEVLDWLPVDIAAAALIQGAQQTSSRHQGALVYHVVNPNAKPTWSDLLSWLREKQAFETLPPNAWVQKLEALGEAGSKHPALQLLEHWKNAYANTETDVESTNFVPEDQPRSERKVFAMDRTSQEIPALRTVEPVSRAYFEKLWQWIVQEAL